MIDSTSIRVHQQAATAKRGIEIIASVVSEAASRPKFMRSSTRKGSRYGLVRPFCLSQALRGKSFKSRTIDFCHDKSALAAHYAL